ncbi:DUF2170 family protein [Candidatus Albibeggiatoa sp. nov. NOAA]|uniref:DUF2170 family protein n=1 Tax=Candidatus Albibeggiatoa sp. nov. NOAA TaxID=3162724 RepID=UPI0032FE0BFF|nr:YjfI family protein [Thiotrichaceae bacterium]
MLTPQEKLEYFAASLDGVTTDNELRLRTEIIASEIDILLVSIEDREDFPIYITVDESQILCMSYLWREEDIKPNLHKELLDTLLSMNLPMPLSSFSKVGNQYIIFGALWTSSTVDELIREIDFLSDNTLTAVEELWDYLIK